MTGTNAHKTPIARALNDFAQAKVLRAIQTLGKALPCRVTAVSGSIITVHFLVNDFPTLPDVTCPMFGPEYIRYPTQVGDLGAVLPADAYLGGVSGLGGGIADLRLPANLSALVFFPIASKNWSASEDANAVVIYGPDGTIIRDTGKQAHVTVDGRGNARIWGLKTFSWDVGGYGVRYTNRGGGAIQQDNYTLGATVTVVNHNINPPEIPSP